MIGFLYRNILKPILFVFPADLVHSVFVYMGEILGRFRLTRFLTKKLLGYSSPLLEQEVFSLKFRNPIGLAAGFDYDARLVNILPSVGFGFSTVGTVTKYPYEGNPKPMLGRLPMSKSLLVNKGFKNAGIKKALHKISRRVKEAPLGVSIGSTNKKYNSFEEIVLDVFEGFKEANQSKDFEYFELNISCPNLINIGDFEERIDTVSGLQKVLERLSSLNIDRPVFIKMPLEKDMGGITALADTASNFAFIKGLVVSNLVKDRNNPFLNKGEVSRLGAGNFSGKPTFEKSNEIIAYVYRKYKDRFIIIGSGGVFSAEDAYLKIKLGATLVQLITGMIYEGPQLIGGINRGLVKLLKKDGYNHIREAVGVLNK